MAEITVATTSWRLLHTNVFSVHAGACYPHCLPSSPLTMKGQRPPMDCSQTLRLMIDGAVVSHLIVLRSHSLPSQSRLTVHCNSQVMNLCLLSCCELFMILYVVQFVVEFVFSASYTNTIKSTRFYTHQICDYMQPSVLLLWDFLSLASCRPAFHTSQHAAK